MAQPDDQIQNLLGNPQLISQLMGMAQSLGGAAPPSPASAPSPTAGAPGVNPAELEFLQKMVSLTQCAGLDDHQTALLQALHPYLPPDRLGKLEKAMRAARLAEAAGAALGGQNLTGR